jgi:type I restriction enzyme S subunit
MDGFFHMNFWHRNGDYVNQRIVRIRKKNLSTLVVYHQIAPFIKFKEEQAKGSTVGHLSDKDMKQLFILVPDSSSLSARFDSILNLMMKQNAENEKLITLRNRLLPLLMNGQVSVEN